MCLQRGKTPLSGRIWGRHDGSSYTLDETLNHMEGIDMGAETKQNHPWAAGACLV